MGDLASRPELRRVAAKLAPGRVLDAGSGTGFLTRQLQSSLPDAFIHSLDRELSLLRHAMTDDRTRRFVLCGDIRSTPYCGDAFDVIVCAGVLMHFSATDLFQIFSEFRRIVRVGGSIVISVPHPTLFHCRSPARRHKDCWLRLVPVVRQLTRPAPFVEHYKDVHGEIFKSIVWSHSAESYARLLRGAGFRGVRCRTILIRRAHLITPRWGAAHSYPGYLHITAEKTSA